MRLKLFCAGQHWLHRHVLSDLLSRLDTNQRQMCGVIRIHVRLKDGDFIRRLDIATNHNLAMHRIAGGIMGAGRKCSFY